MRGATLLLLLAICQPAPAQVLLRGGEIHDGTGKASYRGDVLIQEGKIVKVERSGVLRPPEGTHVINAAGLVIAPGFIDLHSHSDFPLQAPATRANLNFLFQGVTTVVTGNCGAGPADVAEYFKALTQGGMGTNVAHLVPHNTVRRRVMGNANRPPTETELKKMCALVDQGMKDGAWGLATGLIYNPGTYAKTEEIIELCRVVSKHGGIYASHIRNEGVGVLAATEEAIRIGREAGVAVHISHMKASGRQVWGKAGDQLALMIEARKKGQVVTGDQYPYVASSTSLNATLIPAVFREGTATRYQERLRDPQTLARLRKSLEDALKNRKGGADIRIARYAPQPEWQGKDLESIARQSKKDLVELVLEIERNGGAQVVNFAMSEDDVRLIMKHDFVATASDGSSQVPGETVPHPRSYGTFPRKIGHYALKEKLISLEFAIRSCSGLPADILRLKDRGYLRPGYAADIVVFDPKTFRDVATFDRPHQYSPGVRYLFINGKPVIARERFTGELAGQVLRLQESARPVK